VSDAVVLIGEGLLGAAVVGAVATWALGSGDEAPLPAKVRFPTDLTAVQVETLLGHIASLGRSVLITFTVEATAEGLSFGVSAPYGPFHSLTSALRGIAPKVRVEEAEPDRSVRFSYGVRLVWRGPWPLLRTEAPEHAVASLLGGLTGLRSAERLRLVISVGPAGRVRGPQSRQTTAKSAGALERVGFGRPPAASDELRAIRTKLAGPLLRVRLVVAADAGTRGRAEHLLGRVSTALRSRQSGRGYLVMRRLSSTRLRCVLDDAARPSPLGFRRSRLLLSPSELVPLIGWPLQAPRLPGLSYGTAPRLLPSARIPSGGPGRIFGLSDWPGLAGRRLVQPPQGAATHSLILGPTGVGKSTLVTGLALQQAQAGEGFVFLDLKGDAADELLAGLSPKRHDDVIVLDPSGGLPVPGLRTFGTGDPELTADLLLGTFRGLFERSFGVYSEHYLSLAFRTLAHDRHATLADVEPLFGNPAFRQRIIGSLTDPMLRAAWAALDELSPAQRAEQLASPLRKIGALVGRRTIRTVVAQARPRFDLRHVLRRGQIVVVSLSPGRLGSEATRLLAALLLWELYSAVLARQSLPATERRAFGVYLDEPKVLSSIPVPLDSMFELFRGMNVGITMTGQAITQLPKAVQSAALTNAATLVTFRQNARADAELLAHQLPDVSAEQLQHLDKFAAVMRLGLGDGEVAPTVTGTTEPLPAPVADPLELRRSAAERYGHSAEEVDAALAERHGVNLPTATDDAASDSGTGRRRRAS
jgi:hypothetical protein